MIFEGLTVEILDAENKPFVEYKDPVDFEDMETLSNALIEIPAPEKSEIFGLKYKVSKDSPLLEEGTYVSLKLYHEGKRFEYSGQVLSKSRLKVKIRAEDGIQVGRDYDTKSKIYKVASFKSLEIDESEQPSACKNNDQPIYGGYLEIRVWRTSVVPARPKQKSGARSYHLDVGKVSEKELKGKDISHGVVTGAEIRKPTTSGSGKTRYKNLTDEPIHTFRFFYRTRKSLIRRGLVKMPNRDTPNEPTAVEVKQEAAASRNTNRELRRELVRSKRPEVHAEEMGNNYQGQIKRELDGDDDIQSCLQQRRRRSRLI